MADPITARRVLIRVPNWVGDVVHSLPALSAIRTHFVEAELTAIARGEAGTLLDGCPFVDKIESYGVGRSLLAIGQTAAGLRKGNFDLGIVLTNSFEGAFLFFLAGIRRRVGYATDGRRWLLSDPIDCPLSTKRLHQAEYYLAMLSKIGIHTRGPSAKLSLEQSERQKVRERLVKAGWFPHRRLFALCPGAGSGSAKRWPMARFVSLAERLAANLGGQVIFLGGPAERELGRFVDEHGSERLVNFIGKTTLREAMGLIDACELVVSNDSGLLHIAGALGVPVVALFGPTDPERTGPRSGPSVVLRRGVECSPCELHECPIDHRCMDQLAVDEVYAAVVTFIKKQAAGARDLHRRDTFIGQA